MPGVHKEGDAGNAGCEFVTGRDKRNVLDSEKPAVVHLGVGEPPYSPKPMGPLANRSFSRACRFAAPPKHENAEERHDA